MNILIVEDESKTAALLKEMIEEHEECLVVNICQSIGSAVSYLRKHQEKLDLIFMDIQLADGESFEIFKQIEISKPVIFCTSYSEYTLKAFKSSGIDYILKPFQQEDIDASLQKVNNIKQALGKNIAPKAYQNSFIIRFREKMIPVAVGDIALIYTKEETVYVLKLNGEQATIFRTLDEVESLLDPNQFFRINRQMMVQRRAIKDIEPYFNRKVVVNLTVPTPELLVVSRLKVGLFKEWVERPA
jgi:DNA-binding LytR/AlgR family response regulator